MSPGRRKIILNNDHGSPSKEHSETVRRLEPALGRSIVRDSICIGEGVVSIGVFVHDPNYPAGPESSEVIEDPSSRPMLGWRAYDFKGDTTVNYVTHGLGIRWRIPRIARLPPRNGD